MLFQLFAVKKIFYKVHSLTIFVAQHTIYTKE